MLFRSHQQNLLYSVFDRRTLSSDNNSSAMHNKDFLVCQHKSSKTSYQLMFPRDVSASGITRIFSNYSIGIAPFQQQLHSISDRVQIMENNTNRITIATIPVKNRRHCVSIKLSRYGEQGYKICNVPIFISFVSSKRMNILMFVYLILQ